MRRRGRPPYPDILTPREWEVLALLRERRSNPEIAERLSISRDAVKYHVSQILTKLGLTSREEASAWRPTARPWWAAGAALLPAFARHLPLVAKAALAGASLAALGGLAVLTFGVLVTDRTDDDAAALPSASPGLAPVAQVLPIGKIAYVREGDVYVKDLDSGEERLLVNDGAPSRPAWSPTGNWLAFVTGPTDAGFQDLRVVRAHPPATRVFEARALHWAWSPKDDRLAYADASDNSFWLYDPEAGEQRQLLAADLNRGGFVWSPAGDQLAIEHPEKPSDPAALPFTAQRVHIYDFGTGQLFDIFSSTGDVGPARLHSWSPDHQWLLAWSATGSSSLNADGMPLLAIPTVGGEARRLSESTLLYNSFAVWSARGPLVAYVEGGNRSTTANKYIAVRRPGDNNLVGLTPAKTSAVINPDWGPDSTIVAYASSPTGEQEVASPSADALRARRIWTVLADGTGQRQLTGDDAYADDRPLWSRDGSHILFARLSAADIGGDSLAAAELWLMRSDGSEQRKMADVGNITWFGYYGYIDWSQTFDWYRPNLPGQKQLEELRVEFQDIPPYPTLGVVYLNWTGAPPLGGDFRTGDPPETVIDFYARELPLVGWQPEGESAFMPGDPNAEKPAYPQISAIFTKDDLRLAVVAVSNPEKDPSLPTAVSLSLAPR